MEQGEEEGKRMGKNKGGTGRGGGSRGTVEVQVIEVEREKPRDWRRRRDGTRNRRKVG